MSNKLRYASHVKRLSKINLLCKQKNSRINFQRHHILTIKEYYDRQQFTHFGSSSLQANAYNRSRPLCSAWADSVKQEYPDKIQDQAEFSPYKTGQSFPGTFKVLPIAP